MPLSRRLEAQVEVKRESDDEEDNDDREDEQWMLRPNSLEKVEKGRALSEDFHMIQDFNNLRVSSCLDLDHITGNILFRKVMKVRARIPFPEHAGQDHTRSIDPLHNAMDLRVRPWSFGAI